MSFNPDLNKQVQEVVFSRKLDKSSHPKKVLNNAPVVCASWQKHLGMFFDESLCSTPSMALTQAWLGIVMAIPSPRLG